MMAMNVAGRLIGAIVGAIAIFSALVIGMGLLSSTVKTPTPAEAEVAINAKLGEGRVKVSYYVLSDKEQVLAATFKVAKAKDAKATVKRAEEDTVVILTELKRTGLGDKGVIIEGTRKGEENLTLVYSGEMLAKIHSETDPVGIWQWTRSRSVPDYLRK